jgi:hypothetical protein
VPSLLAKSGGGPSDYFRINPMFEPASSKYAWLNDVLAIGLVHRFEQGLVCNVFEVL